MQDHAIWKCMKNYYLKKRWLLSLHQHIFSTPNNAGYRGWRVASGRNEKFKTQYRCASCIFGAVSWCFQAGCDKIRLCAAWSSLVSYCTHVWMKFDGWGRATGPSDTLRCLLTLDTFVTPLDGGTFYMQRTVLSGLVFDLLIYPSVFLVFHLLSLFEVMRKEFHQFKNTVIGRKIKHLNLSFWIIYYQNLCTLFLELNFE